MPMPTQNDRFDHLSKKFEDLSDQVLLLIERADVAHREAEKRFERMEKRIEKFEVEFKWIRDAGTFGKVVIWAMGFLIPLIIFWGDFKHWFFDKH